MRTERKMNLKTEDIKSKLIIKAIRNVRRGYVKDESSNNASR